MGNDVRRVGGLWLAVAVTTALMSPVHASAQTAGFSDVPDGVYYTAPVEALAADGVFAGTECEAAKFCPNTPLKRWEMAVWLVRVIQGQDPPALTASRFADVDASDWYAPHVDQMFRLGITTGCGDGTRFCPDGQVTRAQMAVFLVRAYEWTGSPDISFDDVPHDAWYAEYVGALAHNGVTTGCGDGTRFCPDGQVTRAQMATFLHRAINTGQPATASCDFKDHSSRAVSAVYQVRTSQGIGTAFYIGNDEWLTAAHVIEGETTIALHNGDIQLQATVTAGDSGTDLALLSAPPAATTLRFGVLSGMAAGEAM